MVSLSQDSFYRELNETEIILANMGKFNFDHPDAFDTDLMESVLQVSVSDLLTFILSKISKRSSISSLLKLISSHV